jgi:hypothetical protein
MDHQIIFIIFLEQYNSLKSIKVILLSYRLPKVKPSMNIRYERKYNNNLVMNVTSNDITKSWGRSAGGAAAPLSPCLSM